MGSHTAAEIPNYWAYARDFALDDHMFEPVRSWSLPDHLYMVSAWSARCRTRSPMRCVHGITWLLYARHVSWAYYIETGTQPDCADDSAEVCPAVRQNATTPGIWNPLP